MVRLREYRLNTWHRSASSTNSSTTKHSKWNCSLTPSPPQNHHPSPTLTTCNTNSNNSHPNSSPYNNPTTSNSSPAACKCNNLDISKSTSSNSPSKRYKIIMTLNDNSGSWYLRNSNINCRGLGWCGMARNKSLMRKKINLRLKLINLRLGKNDPPIKKSRVTKTKPTSSYQVSDKLIKRKMPITITKATWLSSPVSSNVPLTRYKKNSDSVRSYSTSSKSSGKSSKLKLSLLRKSNVSKHIFTSRN
jgi:hypothetical protein